MTGPMPAESDRSSADTRVSGGPDGRLYTVPFAHVWDELVEIVARRSRWKLKHKDEELGIITVSCRTLVFRFIDDLTIWVSLDEDGLTEVEALSRSRVGNRDLGLNARRIARMMRRLDDRVGADNRLQGRRVAGRRTGAPPSDTPRADSADGARFA